MSEHIRYIAGGKLGDFIHQLSVVNEYYLKTGRKGIVYIANIGDTFTLGVQRAYDDLYPVVSIQEYISEFKIHNGERVNIDLSMWRNSNLINRSNWNGIYNAVYNIQWGKNKWINIPSNDKYKDCILFNYSRQRKITMDYSFLLKQDKEVLYICFSKSDYDMFYEDFKVELKYIVCERLYDMFSYINGCHYFVGLLSSPLAIALSLHKPCLGFIDIPYDVTMMKGVNIPNYSYYISDTDNTLDRNFIKF